MCDGGTKTLVNVQQRSPPKPLMEKPDEPTSTVTVFQMSRAIDTQSKPGPGLAVVAGTLIVTRSLMA